MNERSLTILFVVLKSRVIVGVVAFLVSLMGWSGIWGLGKVANATHDDPCTHFESAEGVTVIGGTGASETCDGDAGIDSMDAKGGNDHFIARGGDDAIHGRKGNDDLEGRLGDDDLFDFNNGPDRDRLCGGNGADFGNVEDGDTDDDYWAGGQDGDSGSADSFAELHPLGTCPF